MGNHSRTKGHSFERYIARDFQELGFDCQTTRAARGGDWSKTDDGIDLVGTGPFAVQCKKLRNYVPVNTIEEIKAEPEECEPGIVGVDPKTGKFAFLPGEPIKRIPLLITQADYKPTMAVLKWDDLRELIRKSQRP